MKYVFGLLVAIGVQLVARQFVSPNASIVVGCLATFIFLVSWPSKGGEQ